MTYSEYVQTSYYCDFNLAFFISSYQDSYGSVSSLDFSPKNHQYVIITKGQRLYIIPQKISYKWLVIKTFKTMQNKHKVCVKLTHITFILSIPFCILVAVAIELKTNHLVSWDVCC